MKDVKIIVFIKKTKRLKNGECPVFVRVKYKGAYSEVSMKRSVSISKWDASLSRQKGTSPVAKDLNELLDEFVIGIKFRYREFTKNESEFDCKDLLGVVKKNTKANKKFTLLQLVDTRNQFIKEKVVAGIYSNGTLQRHNACLKHLKAFMQSISIQPNFKIEDVDPKFIDQFDHYLSTKGKCAFNTVAKHMTSLKQVTIDALKCGVIKKDPFVSYKIKKKPVVREVLSMAEIKQLQKATFEHEHLGTVRDVFLFQIYTGISYGDLKNLKTTDIIERGSSGYWISMKRGKTDIQFDVPLIPKAIELIDRYRSCQEITSSIFPVLSNQKMNLNLKKVAELSGVKKRLSSHIGRHTFATTIAMDNGVPMETISRVLGHTKIQTTQIYAKVTTKKIRDDFRGLEKVML